MCLLVFSHDNHARYRLVLAGNRDEVHARPAQPAAWWTDAPNVLAGRDLEAGGTWLGLTTNGRFAVVTNYREAPSEDATADKLSRGALVSEFLQTDAPAREFVAALHAAGPRYRGFSLIVGDGSQLWSASNRASAPRALERGVYGLSNHLLDVPWPKVVHAKAQLRGILARGASTAALLDMLDERAPLHEAATGTAAESAFERAASAIFVNTPRYGTRCSTVITITHDGDVEFVERSFDSAGTSTGERHFAFRIDAGR